MTEEQTKSSNPLIKLLLILFAMFLIMYFSRENGYYEYKNYNKSKLTSEAILKFEKDVEEGKDVSINDYIVNDYVDYSNVATKTGSKISKLVETFMNEGIKKTLKYLSALFYE